MIYMSGTLLSTQFSHTRGENGPLVILLIGPPGSGKGTHAVPLSAHLGIPHISTGDLFRENIRGQTNIGIQAKKFIDQGKLVPDEVVLAMLFERTAKEDCRRGYILDGCPRTLPQGVALDCKMGKNCRVMVLYFQVSDDLLVERITGRLACKGCGKPFHIKYSPPLQPHICDDCGGELCRRDDDREEILRKRLEVYHRETEPLIDYYALKPDTLYTLNASISKELVFQSALESLSAVSTF